MKKPIKVNKKLLRQLSESDLRELIDDLQQIHDGKNSICCNIEFNCSNNKCGFLKKFDFCSMFSCNTDISDIDAKISIVP